MTFFSDVQSWLKGDFGGRYIGKIMLEWYRDDRAGFKKFIDKELRINLPADYRLEEEFSYRTLRRADLAIFPNDQSSTPAVLIEIKWDDSLIVDIETGESQLEDYVEYCGLHKECYLLVLTKDPLTYDEQIELVNLGGYRPHCYFGVLFNYLNNSQSKVAQMFLDYLQDKGVVMNKIEPEVLFRFFHRFVNPPKGSRQVVSEDQLSSGPDQFRNMMNNMRLIAQDISSSSAFFEIKGINRKATIDFKIYPFFSKKLLSDALEDEDNKNELSVMIEPEARVGGEIYIYATETISRPPKLWRQIEYGFWFNVESNPNHEFLNVSVYAGLNGEKIEWADTESEEISSSLKKLIFDGNKKPELVVIFKKKICEAIEKAINKDLVDSDELMVVLNKLSN